EMPDLNQRNELLADYLIQNTIWWIEYSGIDGIRMDTHPYPYQDYMAEWTRRVLEEYPNFNIVGEAWMPNAPTTAWWQFDSILSGDYNSYLPSVTDFPLYFALVSGINEQAGWDTGLARLYYTLGQDFLYTDPFLNVIFFDNHDLTRFMTSVGEDPDKFKLGVAFTLTTRGVPQIYYGSEIMKMGGEHDPDKRRTFPGGWPGDEINAFTPEGREELGKKRNLPIPEMFDYIRTISHWRETKEVIHTGKLTHFIPENNVYVYFRHNDEESVMVILNGQNEAQTLETSRFTERLAGFTHGVEVYSNDRINIQNEFTIGPMDVLILELE
ncbi:MAG: cyclomaltodextrinase C-terminal domain-containing protein, partial [Balneolaceae bacterium]